MTLWIIPICSSGLRGAVRGPGAKEGRGGGKSQCSGVGCAQVDGAEYGLWISWVGPESGTRKHRENMIYLIVFIYLFLGPPDVSRDISRAFVCGESRGLAAEFPYPKALHHHHFFFIFS